MKKTQIVGLVLWRGGVLLGVGYLVFRALRLALRVTDPQLELGVALVTTGVVLLVLSLIGERIEDTRQERSLEE